MDNRASRIRNSMMTAVFLIAVFLFVGISTPGYADVGLNVTTHSKNEIVTKLSNSGVSISDPVNYSIAPVINTVRGEMTSETKNSALAMLNNVRYISGIEPVSLDTTQSNKAQAAAFVMWSTDQFTHNISGPKPSEMSEEDWSMGVEGAGKSNIGWGYQSLNRAIVEGWMEDSDKGNVSRVGHRRWCLNPEMDTTGFGKAGAYTAMWSFDRSASSGAKRVAWPAQKMPVEFFGDDYPWSLSIGDSSITNVSNVNVDLTRRASSPSGSGSWTFSTSRSYTASDSGEYFNVAKNNPYEGYSGQGGPYVVFRPANISYRPGDIFDVSVTGLGSSTISYTVEFFSGYPVESITFDKSEYILTSSYTYVYETIDPENASGYEISWSTGDKSIATVSSNGKLTRVAPGTTTVTATVSGDYTSDGKPRTATAVVRVPKSINSSDITFNDTNSYVQYTGSQQRPDITVTDNGVTLKENVDYEINAPYNAIEPGYYAYSITGIGSYYGTKNNFYLVIQKKQIDQSMIQLSPASAVYNGNRQTPGVTVKNGSLTLAENTDYTLINNGGINAGTYNVTVKAASGSTYYTGNASVSFTISAKPISESMVSLSEDEFTYNGSSRIPAVSVKDGSTTLTKDTDYTVTASNSINSGNYEISVTGKGNYKGTVTKSYKIKTLDISSQGSGVQVELGQSSYTYDGNTHIPTVSVKHGSKTLKEGDDYVLTAQSGVDAGTYDITVRGKGASGVDATCNYTGEVTRQFSIGKKALTADMITLSASSFKYDAETHKPGVTVSYAGKDLVKGTDYSIENNGGVDVGDYQVVITALDGSNYSGSVSKDYSITAKPLDDSMISGVEDRTYDGTSKKPSFTVTGDVTYETVNDGEGKDAGTYTVKIKGTGNYGGEASKSYTINARDINADGISFDKAAAAFTGSRITPVFTANDEHGSISSSDYTSEYDNAGDGIGAGVYQVSITGRNNYKGTRKAEFEILKKDIDSIDVTVAAIADQQYTGNAIEPDVSVRHGSRTLKQEDYQLEFSRNTEIGTAAVTITGKGNYEGTRSASFKIVEKVEEEPEKPVPIQQPDPTEGLSASDKAAVSEIAGKLGVTPAQAIEINNYAKANGISKETLKITDSAVTGGNTDSDLKGAEFGQLQAFAKKNTKNAITLQWKKVKNADGYLVYGSKCGKNNKMKLLKTCMSGKMLTFTNKRLKKGTYYKYIVIAYRNYGGTKVTIAASPTIHSVTKGGKYGVAKSVSVTKVGNVKSTKLVLKKGKTAKITAKEVKEDKTIKTHRKMAYESSNSGVASVSKKGVIKAAGKGKCKIYVYAQNGKQKTISVTVN